MHLICAWGMSGVGCRCASMCVFVQIAVRGQPWMSPSSSVIRYIVSIGQSLSLRLGVHQVGWVGWSQRSEIPYCWDYKHLSPWTAFHVDGRVEFRLMIMTQWAYARWTISPALKDLTWMILLHVVTLRPYENQWLGSSSVAGCVRPCIQSSAREEREGRQADKYLK